MNIFSTKSGPIFAIFVDFSEFCSTFGTLHFEKIIKYYKKFGENEEKSFNYSISLKVATLGTKNVNSAGGPRAIPGPGRPVWPLLVRGLCNIQTIYNN